MKLTLYATRPAPIGALRLVQAMLPWSMKTRRAPSRHCRDARVYGHTTTAMHDMTTPSPPAASFSRGSQRVGGEQAEAIRRAQGLHPLLLRRPSRWNQGMLQNTPDRSDSIISPLHSPIVDLSADDLYDLTS